MRESLAEGLDTRGIMLRWRGIWRGLVHPGPSYNHPHSASARVRRHRRARALLGVVGAVGATWSCRCCRGCWVLDVCVSAVGSQGAAALPAVFPSHGEGFCLPQHPGLLQAICIHGWGLGRCTDVTSASCTLCCRRRSKLEGLHNIVRPPGGNLHTLPWAMQVALERQRR
jgi:hypothetical protein